MPYCKERWWRMSEESLHHLTAPGFSFSAFILQSARTNEIEHSTLHREIITLKILIHVLSSTRFNVMCVFCLGHRRSDSKWLLRPLFHNSLCKASCLSFDSYCRNVAELKARFGRFASADYLKAPWLAETLRKKLIIIDEDEFIFDTCNYGVRCVEVSSLVRWSECLIQCQWLVTNST